LFDALLGFHPSQPERESQEARLSKIFPSSEVHIVEIADL
jgi:hypothetical protein